MMEGAEQFEFRYIPAGLIQVPDYQRSQPGKVDRFAKEFDPDLFSPIIVGEDANGAIWADDGNTHREAAIKAYNANVLVPCWVRKGWTREAGARRFRRINEDRGPVNAGTGLKAGEVYDDPCTVDLLDAVSLAGLDYQWTGRPSSDRLVSCWGALKEIWRKDGPDMVKDALTFSVSAFDGERESMAAHSVKGVWEFIRTWRKHPNYSREEAIQKMRSIGWEALYKEAARTKLNHSFPVAKSIRVAMQEFYNQGRPTKKKLQG
jgi:hypothetical protein